MAVARVRPFHGPAILSYGFRPFFLFGALYTGVTMLVWIPLSSGRLDIANHFAPVDWHVHEMLFGYLAAVIAGFLLTAIPNWTGRLPLNGIPLAILVLLWGTGRVAMCVSTFIPPLALAVLDCSFLVFLAAAAAREIIAGQNWRNLKVLLPVSVFLLANVLFHIEVNHNGTSDFARRLGIGSAIMLIGIIGGRIIPSFTRNWLATRPRGRMPASFGRFDICALALLAAALVGWAFIPASAFTGWLLIGAATANLLRLARWRGERTIANPLVLVLHLGFVWVPVGLAIAGLAALMPERIGPAAVMHAFGVGAIGTMTLAVMVRATLGHTGRTLSAGWRGSVVFASILVAAVTRVAHALFLPVDTLLYLSAAAWVVTFLGFAIFFGPYLLAPKVR